MDRQDAKPHRPSLLAGADNRSNPSSNPSSAAAATPARILSDMEGRKPRAARPGLRRVSLVIGLAGLALLAGYGLLAGRDATADADTHALPSTATRPAPLAAPAVETTAAIVDENVDEPMRNEIDDSSVIDAASVSTMENQSDDASGNGANPFAVMSASHRPLTSAAASTTSAAATPARSLARTAPSRVAVPRQRTSRSIDAQAGSDEDTDLLATLLRNIEQSPATDPGVKRDTDALDALVRQVRAGEGASATGHARNAASSTPSHSRQIQSRLQACPPANTTAGLQCRQRICASHAGRDPACPAQ